MRLSTANPSRNVTTQEAFRARMPSEGVGDCVYRHRLSFGRTPSGFCPSWPFCLTRFNFLRLVFIGRWERRWRVTKPSVNPGFSLEFVPCFGSPTADSSLSTAYVQQNTSLGRCQRPICFLDGIPFTTSRGRNRSRLNLFNRSLGRRLPRADELRGSRSPSACQPTMRELLPVWPVRQTK